MSSKTVYLSEDISSAQAQAHRRSFRSKPYGLASTLAARPNVIPNAPTFTPSNSTRRLYGNTADNAAAIAHIKKIAGQLDVIIANAGINNHFSPLVTTPLPAFREHFEVNTLGPVILFQAAYKLLLVSPTGAPVFAVISSAVGSMGRFGYISATPYGMSGAAANYLVKTLDVEHPMLFASAIQSGWVSTDMGNKGTLSNGMGRSEALVSLEDSVAEILTRIDGATKKKSSGKFWNFKVAHGNPWDVETDGVPW
ncbi:hypothetical protein DFH08DRAFT_1089670 [Mycena albidolilacea]|uniref:NAD(P)-binding protein n=1 Tax=Mycena albidolilacea TaxID=1033008 RepID=A0AAD6Z156_9AGAR|nr:hypothetical protein DFH08DRAFT_1089670 [Mycena albidolilacea]